MFGALLKGTKRSVLLRAGALIAAIALLDWRVIAQVPLGFLYLIPMVMVGSVLERLPIVAIAIVCTLLAEVFGDLDWNVRTGTSRDLLYFAAFVGTGFFIREVNNSRRTTLEHLHEIERERDARRETEEQLRILIESSPVAILTADQDGCVLTANDAAHRMLGVLEGELRGRVLYRYLPALTNITMHDPSLQLLRAVMQARGQRDDGEAFLADICFSTYRTNAGTRLAAMVLDTSEDLRAHEVSGLQQLLSGSRIAVGAVFHEIRNVCGAIAVVHQNLARGELLVGNKDFEALGSLTSALERIASVNVRQKVTQAAEVDLGVLLDELKIIVAPLLQEESISTEWLVEPGLPPVWADRSSLMQVFLNLVTNSARALAKKDRRCLSVIAKSEGEQIHVEFSDSGGGVVNPEYLFRPFQAGAEATGLGLYLSRAFMRSFGGELRYMPLHEGACFIADLTPASIPQKELLWMKPAF
jgi:two-component system, LuxR family, sensor kinase FixL